MTINIFVITIVVILLVLFVIKLQRKRLRESLKLVDFNPAWVMILQNNLALYNKLPDLLKKKLHGLINIFLHEKTFSGYNGLIITDEIKVTIAAQACMLVLNRNDDLYPSLKNVFMYPDAFKSMQTKSDGMVETIQETVRIGESWTLGHVVLSWRHSKQGAMNAGDAQNVVYHEFAHQLDHEDGAIDGTPILDLAENYESWSKVFTHEYNQLRNKISANKKTLIDEYGTVSEGEFFAVVTELFFERPILFDREHPELYKELKQFYHLDPLEWF